MDKEVKSQLRGIVGENWFLDSKNELYTYSYDATPLYQAMPDAVVLPSSVEEVAAVLKVANEYKIPITSRGSGSNLCGGTVPVDGGIVLVTTRLNQLKEIDQENLTATFGPGLITADLHKAVEAQGLFYPPDPGSMRISTMGGNVAECAGGMRGLKYGVTKDYIMGLQAALPNGEVLRVGGKNAKDVAGYDITKLLVGSEGTLAVVTEITAKLLPLPSAKQTLVAYYNDLTDAARTVQRVIAQKIIPATMEFLDQATMVVVEDFAKIGLPLDMQGMLIIEQDGTPLQVESDVERIAQICRAEGAVEVRTAQTAEEGATLMAARRAALSALARMKPTTILEDATVPRARLAEMVEQVNVIAKKHSVHICTFGHAGDGNLHPTCMTDERDQEEIHRVEQAFEEIFHAAIKLGGTITGEHGVGMAKAGYLELKVGQNGIEIMKRIKEAFDPNGIMNPGKIFAKSSRRRVVVSSHACGHEHSHN
ncbi:FAD-linked oxidase C-terminal domain-containing protein [Aneurinibacillus sp. Ricciae_BoGa-3]|uniref:FAD-binding oxidoreductase n=1 Tax=Aneurinibacillus sp. Ricciae_BoGa-3 TaxID=3022697 RepID=UPI002341BEFE|nr:FAD-linked oxidase C-terminal domain-containing protein [Aneurinibacillus sp. Ricciae_BoGa-3]WCK55112.1 FAD-linked oxidase C-terminal domain-containing protein [Aneurinibacillus sp. Ricciae_BoGa-3]